MADSLPRPTSPSPNPTAHPEPRTDPADGRRTALFTNRVGIMSRLWFYARGAELFGPFSGWEVADLADAGAVLRTDTVWEDASEDGVPAAAIPHLFPIVEPAPPTPPPPVPPAYPPRPVAPQRRAVAGPGAVLCGQDGKTVRYTKRCVVCKKEDRCVSTATIVAGTMRSHFFCPKCCRRRPVEIQGR